MLETKNVPLLPRRIFLRQFVRCFVVGLMIVVVSLGMGILGYHHFEGMSWVDAFANAAMILSGMGPLEPVKTTPGKVFAGCYALYSGLALITVAVITFSPVV